MAEIQGAVMGKYVNKLEQQHLQNAKKIKKLQAKVETLTSQKYKLDEEKRSEDTLVKHLQSKVRKTETGLQKEREKVSYLKPRNVKRREETKQKQIVQLKHKVEKKANEIKSLKEIVEKTKVTMAQSVKQSVQEATKLTENVEKLQEKVATEKTLKLRAQKVASKWR